MKLGVCYYPEHWPEARWADDARRMREMGIRFLSGKEKNADIEDLKKGDVVTLGIEGLGEQRQLVVPFKKP